MFIRILIWTLNKVFNGKNRKKLEPCIKELYRRMAQDANFKLENELSLNSVRESYRRIAKKNLKIKSEIVKVKKGKRRYDLLFLETPDGKLKINLGRHWELNTDYKKELQLN